MEKPKNYAIYNNKKKPIPYSEWPQEIKEYKNWRRSIIKHPEWKDLSDDEWRKAVIESKKKRAESGRKAFKVKYENMSEEEKKVLNKKKSSWKKENMTEEEYKEKCKHMAKISNKFWNGMTEEQRKDFSKYRWNLRTDEEKKIIIKRFNQAGIDRMKSLPKEEIDRQIKVMNEARLKKLEEDDKFREEQFRLLRKHNQEYFGAMTDEEKSTFYKNIGKKRGEQWRLKWNSDEEFRKEWSDFLKSHCKDFLGSMSPEERHEFAMKGGIASAAKWSDLEFSEKQSEIRRLAHYKYLESLSKEDKYKMLTENRFTKKFEKQFNDSMLSESFYYEKEYGVKNNTSFKHWDYGIFNKSDNELVMLVDLDGSYFHADSGDYTGIHSVEETDERRGYFIPDGVKVQIIEENRFIDGFKEMMISLSKDYDGYIDGLFKLYRSIGFPYPQYSNMDLINSFKQLKKLNPEHKYLKLSTRNREGDRLITHFHQSIYRAHRKNCISPYNAWYDDELLRKCIENRTLYRSNLNPNKILQGFNVSRIAPKVSVFSAGRAKILIHKYLNEFNEIFDPFSGFSGRMLGCMSLGKHYIGQDISGIHINESCKMLEFFRITKNAHYPDIIMPNLSTNNVLSSTGVYECLFTCPPYADKEIWLKVDADKRTCDDWIDICLNNFKCKRYLFVVDNTEKYKDYIVDEIINRSYLNINKEYVVLINRGV